MSLSIKEAFRVEAPPDLVWEFLLSPTDVVRCLPGADLTDTIDERTFAGRVKVKVGPITTAYAGQARVTEIDPVARRMKMVGEGKETGGSGSARLTMSGSVHALDDGASEVHVDAAIDIAGKVMQFGRGLVESVSRQMFKQFVEATQATLVRATGERAALAAATPATGPEIEPELPPPAATSVMQTTLSHSATFTAEHRTSVEQVSLARLVWRLIVERLRRIFR